ncbi:uncharacterized protein LOC122091387 isoform X2 [Macadamia integrifolia]|uniref:uncharacterized protein LOC122091387 isoform X2 n=1 Tax=Macadamia integrifolia TaxID=60698 RepID=UPI001C500A90|nr:uncharacterized protein LOC122091387 isoform X2 [Macadamia integrifolia]
MAHAFIHSVIFLLYLCCFIASCIPTNHDNRIDSKTLFVGEELQKETLPLQMGSCFYLLSGLKPSRWYEVKISYPASIPTSFTIQLKIGKSDLEFNWNRRLLNTEKLIFRADSRDFNSYKWSLLGLLHCHMYRRDSLSFLILFVMNYYLGSLTKLGGLES